jgi:hypothetical protein
MSSTRHASTFSDWSALHELVYFFATETLLVRTAQEVWLKQSVDVNMREWSRRDDRHVGIAQDMRNTMRCGQPAPLVPAPGTCNSVQLRRRRLIYVTQVRLRAMGFARELWAFYSNQSYLSSSVVLSSQKKVPSPSTFLERPTA